MRRVAEGPCCEAVGARGERSVFPASRPQPPLAANHNEISTPWAAVLGPEEQGPVSLSEAVLPEAEGSVG